LEDKSKALRAHTQQAAQGKRKVQMRADYLDALREGKKVLN